MKTTTYILGAMVLGLFLSIAVGVATMYYFSQPLNTQELHFSGEITTQQLPACSVLKVIHQDTIVDNRSYPHSNFFTDSRLQVSGTSAAAPLFSFPSSCAPFFRLIQQADTVSIILNIPLEERLKHVNAPHEALWIAIRDLRLQLPSSFFRLIQQADTVSIILNIPLEERLKHVNAPHEALWIAIRDLRLQLPSSVQQLEVSLRNMPVEFFSMHQDSLSCRIDGTATLDSCCFQSLSMHANAVHYNSGTIDRLYMDLDVVSDWTMQSETCRIGTEYLQGSGIHTVQRGECCKLRWFPKNSEASLQLSLSQAVQSETCRIGTEYLQGSGIHTVQRGECCKLRWFPKNSEASLQLSLSQAAEIQLLE